MPQIPYAKMAGIILGIKLIKPTLKERSAKISKNEISTKAIDVPVIMLPILRKVKLAKTMSSPVPSFT